MDGIIFGGAVRDEIIADHYIQKYNAFIKSNKIRYNHRKFWDITHHPESAARTLVADDVDIFFSNTQDSNNFINVLTRLCEEERVSIVIQQNDADDPANNPRRYSQILNVQKITLTIPVGSIPFTFRGYDIVLDIDIVTPLFNIEIQPPFRNVDFLCNVFIKTKFGLVLSNYTGIYLDNLSAFDRANESIKIMNDMIQFKTYFCRFEKYRFTQPGTFKYHKFAFKRINKLLKKETFKWSICNLPFDIRAPTIEETHGECCICITKLNDKDRVAAVSVIKNDEKITCSCSHLSCFMQYLNHQYDEALHDYTMHNNAEFSFKCPVRTPIDLTKCTYDYIKRA